MSKLIDSLILLLLPLNLFAQSADVCPQPDPGWTIAQVAEWAQRMDRISSLPRRTGAYKTIFGNPVDESCRKGLSDEAWNKRFDHMEKSLAYAMTQGQSCFKHLGIPVAEGVISTLRLSKIHCGDMDKVLASATQVLNGEIVNCSKHYDVHDWGKAMDNQTVESAASIIFHEALHWSVSNNRSWHNEVAKKTSSCANSVFEDRVYMLQAACFPSSKIGRVFYRDVVNCPGLCERTLTTLDESRIDQFIEYKGHESLGGHNYTQESAKLMCGKMRSLKRALDRNEEEKEKMIERRVLMSDGIDDVFGHSGEVIGLKDAFKSAYYAYGSYFNPGTPIGPTRKTFFELKATFQDRPTKACQGERRSKDLDYFCKTNRAEKNRFTEELDRLALRIKEDRAILEMMTVPGRL